MRKYCDWCECDRQGGRQKEFFLSQLCKLVVATLRLCQHTDLKRNPRTLTGRSGVLLVNPENLHTHRTECENSDAAKRSFPKERRRGGCCNILARFYIWIWVERSPRETGLKAAHHSTTGRGSRGKRGRGRLKVHGKARWQNDKLAHCFCPPHFSSPSCLPAS